MICLFLDTSSSYLSSAVIKNGVVLKEIFLLLEKDMSKYALFKIKEMLEELELVPNDIDKIICVNGPGSFTGLRVGVTIAKTFAWGLNKELSSVSSLFAMATSIKDKDYIVPVIDARRDYLFAGIYDKDYNNIMEDCYISKENLLNKVAKLDGDYCLVSTTDIKDVETIKYNPDITNLIINLKENMVSAHELVPNYLKSTEAEEKLND